MNYGMPTLIELDTIEECAGLCRELGLQFIEFNMNLPQYQPDTVDADRLERVAREYGIFYTIHLDENMNVADFNPYVTEGYFRTVRETIALAKRLEIPVLNMHLSRGVHFTLPERKVFLFERYREEYLKGITSFRDLCQQEIGDSPVKVCLENYSGYTGFQKEAIEVLLQSPVFGLTLDVGHNHCTDYMDEPVVMANKNRLHHIHMHDVKGKNDHQALGAGDLDLNKYFDLAQKCNCTVLLETKTVEGLRQSVQWLKQNRNNDLRP